jgi:hypothetical protein
MELIALDRVRVRLLVNAARPVKRWIVRHAPASLRRRFRA